jgi:hypothetical protein
MYLSDAVEEYPHVGPLGFTGPLSARSFLALSREMAELGGRANCEGRDRIVVGSIAGSTGMKSIPAQICRKAVVKWASGARSGSAGHWPRTPCPPMRATRR